jgi:hypothetical protein
MPAISPDESPTPEAWLLEAAIVLDELEGVLLPTEEVVVDEDEVKDVIPLALFVACEEDVDTGVVVVRVALVLMAELLAVLPGELLAVLPAACVSVVVQS